MATRDEYNTFVKEHLASPKVRAISDHKERRKYVGHLWKAKGKKESKEQYEFVNIGDPSLILKQLDNLSVNFDAAIDESAKGLSIHRTKFGVIAEASLMSDLIMDDLEKTNDFLLTDTIGHDKIKKEIRKIEQKHRIAPKLQIASAEEIAPIDTGISRDKQKLLLRSQRSLDKLQKNLDSLKLSLH